MKAYQIITGTVFGLITLAHLWRILIENPALAKSPLFMVLTVVIPALSIWAWRLLKCLSQS